jgi:hypothetical protein
MSDQPLAEVFGFPPGNFSDGAISSRNNRLCPYNNGVPNCTKVSKIDPLGVCSVRSGGSAVITCPVRFRENWIIAEDTARFFFPAGTQWTAMSEVRLRDNQDMPAGNIDMVLVAYDDNRHVIDFGAVEVQSVYISGNVRQPFDYYMEDPTNRYSMQWQGQVRPDFLSSSRKRLAPQLLYKGNIINGWGKKLAVVLDRSFFQMLPTLTEVSPDESDMAWFIYDLELDTDENRYHLKHYNTVHTMFSAALQSISQSVAGPVEQFVARLQTRLDQQKR